MKRSGKIAGFIVLFVCMVIMLVFIYGLIRVSLQDGESSSRITQSVITRIGEAVFDDELNADQVNALNLFLRSLAHFFLFSFLSYGLCAIAFLMFRSVPGRIAGLSVGMIISAALAYYTEYYKQFVEGRHFQIEDAWLNMYGVVLGLCSFLITGFIFYGIHVRNRNHR